MTDSSNSPLLLQHVIHLPALYALADGDRSFAEDLLQIFVTDALQQFERLQQAITIQDFSEVYQTAHALKGACGSIGATQAQDLCHSLEQQAKTQMFNAVNDQVAELEQQLQQIASLAAAEISIPTTIWEQVAQVITD